jgi:hypothetical protein
MRQSLKRTCCLTGILILFCCFIGLIAASAAEKDTRIGDLTLIQSGPYLDPPGLESDDSRYASEGWKWELETKTLTLKNAAVSGKIEVPNGTTVVLTGKNSAGRLSCSGNLTITGFGSLTAEQIDTWSADGSAFLVEIRQANVAVQTASVQSLLLKHAKLAVTGSLESGNGSFVIDDSTLTVGGGGMYALRACSISVIDSVVTVDPARKTLNPVCTEDGRLLSAGSTITAAGHAVYSYGDLAFYAPNGQPLTEGWYFWAQNGSWYYLYENGWAHQGMLEHQGKWYLLTPIMLTDAYTGHSYFDLQGVMQTGWVQPFLNRTGSKSWIYFDENGQKVDGWFTWNGDWYYQPMGAAGTMATGWRKIDGAWYYFGSDGAMRHDTTVDGYTLGHSGRWVQ